MADTDGPLMADTDPAVNLPLSFEDACAGWDLSEPEQGVMGHYWMEGDSLAPPCQVCVSDLHYLA